MPGTPVVSNSAYMIGALVGIQGAQGFFYQASSPRNVAQKAIALSNIGEAAVVEYYDGVLEVTIDAIIPNATAKIPQAGDIVVLYGIQAPTMGSSSTFMVTGSQSDVVHFYVENPTVKSVNKDFQAVSFTAWRGLANGLPASTTATAT